MKNYIDYLTKIILVRTFTHAGISILERNERQLSWTNSETRVMVTTNAFGMGIDKSNVRLVIHYHIPSNLETYFQETGRVGRDKKSLTQFFYIITMMLSIYKNL